MTLLKTPIKNWPSSERPRERLLQSGAEFLSDAELLAIILGSGSSSAGVNAIDIARALIHEYDGLDNLSTAIPQELMKIKGIGITKATALCAAFEISRRLNSRPLSSGVRILSSRDVYEFLSKKLTGQKKEFFYSILLNGKNRILKCELISVGSLTCSIVHPRESFLPAIRCSAASIIFAHNHPSGDPSPSHEDRLITRRLYEAGEIIGIKVLDHVIIGDNNYYSFAEHNSLGGQTFREGGVNNG